MKGQSKFIEYMMTVLLSVLVLAGISALVYSFYRNAVEKEAKTELTQIATQIKGSLIKVYDAGKGSKIQPSNYTSVLISEVDLNLPYSIARFNYEVELVSATSLYSYITATTLNGTNVSSAKDSSVAKIVARTTQEPIVKVEFDLPNLDLTVQGKIKNGLNDVLKYYRYNQNNTVYDTVILGEPDIIIRINSVS